jgi:hypothetical protein
MKNSSDNNKDLSTNNFTCEYDFGVGDTNNVNNYDDDYDDNNIYDIIQGDVEYELEDRNSCYSSKSNSYSF